MEFLLVRYIMALYEHRKHFLILQNKTKNFFLVYMPTCKFYLFYVSHKSVPPFRAA